MDGLVANLDFLNLLSMFDGIGFSLLIGGRTRCSPTWRSSGMIETSDCKLYIPRAGQGFYDIGDGEQALTPGSLYLIPGQRRHRYRCPRLFDVDWLHARILDRSLARLMAGQNAIRRWPLSAWRSWRPVHTRFAEFFVPQRPAALGLRIQALLACLFADLVAEAPTVEPASIPPWLEGALGYLETHHQRDPSLAEVARRVGITPIHLQRSFTTAVGVTPRLWMERRRMEAARRLLVDRAMSVSAVARDCGYADAFHFSRVFRRFHGLSPRQWRTQSGPGP